MGDCLFARKGAVHTVPIVLKPAFADNTWAEIAQACHRNRVPDSWEVGDRKTMTINGVAYWVNIIGKNHDDYTDGTGKAPLTFQLRDCYDTRNSMNDSSINMGGWASSRMRTTHLPAIMALMPTEVQAGIREVNKRTSEGNASNIIQTTADKMFLLSETEVRGTMSNSFPGEGSRYEYYSRGNSSVKSLSGTATPWWTRSPRFLFTTQFCHMDTGNNISEIALAASALGVAFAFCF